MDERTILVTGQSLFIHRFQYLFQGIEQHFRQVNYLPIIDLPVSQTLPQKVTRKARTALRRIAAKRNGVLHLDPMKYPETFVQRSLHTEQQIRQLDYTPDLIFHIFCMCSPLWQQFDIPFVMFLDYTMALAKRNWSSWAPFVNEREYAMWIRYERLTYDHAHQIFCVSNQVKSSLVQDYGVHPEKITVTGSSANFSAVYGGDKKFGSRRMLFNASDFERKGGDLVLAAFRQVRKVLPDVTLVVIGGELPEEEGIENPGHIGSREAMQDLLLDLDLVLAPARCDPFPVLPMEAMNFGVPCIVSDCDGNPDIVDHKVNGIVLSQSNAESLAREIIRLLNNPAQLQSMSLQARQKIKNQLNWNKIAQNISQAI
jgi:glycosyltransferase involved in cell wall biosynthesis